MSIDGHAQRKHTAYAAVRELKERGELREDFLLPVLAGADSYKLIPFQKRYISNSQAILRMMRR
jgi:hypothetical protein